MARTMDAPLDAARSRYELLRQAAALAHQRWVESPPEEQEDAARRYRDLADLEYEALRALGGE